VEIKEEFEAMKPQVIELHQPMSPAMTEIQTAIIESMDATLAEVRRGNTNVCQLGFAPLVDTHDLFCVLLVK
jgi:DNA excision repair protein ERCC-4